MPNKRRLKLKDYGISPKRNKELMGFCEQYKEWRDELRYKNTTVKSQNISDMPKGTNGANATEALAIRRVELEEKCKIIEQTAIEASPDLYQYIIKNVTEEAPLWYLRDIMGMPCSRATFYDARRYFFYLLDKRKT